MFGTHKPPQQATVKKICKIPEILFALACVIQQREIRVPQKEVDKKSSITFYRFRDSFGHFLVTFSDASVTFLVTFLPNSFCRTPFAAGWFMFMCLFLLWGSALHRQLLNISRRPWLFFGGGSHLSPITVWRRAEVYPNTVSESPMLSLSVATPADPRGENIFLLLKKIPNPGIFIFSLPIVSVRMVWQMLWCRFWHQKPKNHRKKLGSL